jgi:diaminopimelate decarboxylase
VRLLAELGAGVHANTPGDAHAALAAGVRADAIAYSGTNLDADDFAFLIARGIRMNLDSLDQVRDYLRHGGRAPIGLRVLVDDGAASRIGVEPEEIARALAAGATVAGLHMYAGTNTRRAGRFLACFDRLIEAAAALPDLAWLDAGGGFGVAYVDDEEPLDVELVGAAIAARMEALSARRGRRIELLVEPGRALVAQAGTLYARVVSVKHRRGRRFVGVDTTVGNLVVPSVYHRRHRVAAVAPRGAPLEVPTDVCGNTTHSRDFLARGVRLPELRAGDLIALADVGAYGYAMSSHFLNRPRPAEVVIDGGEAHLTTRRETLADLLATQS